MRILISGGTGLIGSYLVDYFEKLGHRVLLLTRRSARDSKDLLWNFVDPIEPETLESFDSIVHLAGESIASSRWTSVTKKKIRDSRVIPTRELSSAIAALNVKPSFVCASAIGYYGDRGDEILTEEAGVGSGFLADVCRDWETATDSAKLSGARVVNLRIGIVLSKNGGALKKMLPPFRFGLGGPLGSGNQYMSWIELSDLVRAIDFTVKNAHLLGPINAVGPSPLTNLEFSKLLSEFYSKRLGPKIPRLALKILLGEMADDLMLSSMRVLPNKLEAAGFKFNYPRLLEALRSILN